MCLAVPMRVKKIDGDMAIVEDKGVETEVNISVAPDLKVDDKVLIHAGFVIEKLDEEAAKDIEDAWDIYNKTLNS